MVDEKAIQWVGRSIFSAPLPPVPTAREAREAFLQIAHGRGTPEHRETVLWFLFNAIEREEGRGATDPSKVCPCDSGQPAGACSLCDAYPWDPPPSRTP